MQQNEGGTAFLRAPDCIVKGAQRRAGKVGGHESSAEADCRRWAEGRISDAFKRERPFPRLVTIRDIRSAREFSPWFHN